jgi:UDP-N-acetylglucosamine 2-epimerase (non-hydrolysing)
MNLTFVMGTRPEVIKLAPMILEAKRRGLGVNVVHTGQHVELTRSLMQFFDIIPDVYLDAMLEKPSLTGLSARVLSKMDETLEGLNSDWIIVQGDTTSSFIAAYWAFCRRIPIAHVEAGLRTGDRTSPFPEEANRQMIARLANIHFAPTAGSRDFLLKENVAREDIFVVGNTAIDALHYALTKIQSGVSSSNETLTPETQTFMQGRRVIAATVHRRENHGEPLQAICRSLIAIANRNPEVGIVLPVHPNPNVRGTVMALLGNHPQIHICEPIGYIGFIELISKAELIITDSGGVQEEAPSLKKPILVVRETTERPEGVTAGFARLVGSDEETIIESACEILESKPQLMMGNPYGDGASSTRILDALALRSPSKHAPVVPTFELPYSARPTLEFQPEPYLQ